MSDIANHAGSPAARSVPDRQGQGAKLAGSDDESLPDSVFDAEAVVILHCAAVVSARQFSERGRNIGALLAIGVVGAMGLRNDDRLSDESFLKLVIEAYKRLPLLKGGDSEKKALEE